MQKKLFLSIIVILLLSVGFYFVFGRKGLLENEVNLADKINGDVNSDGKVTSKDYLLVKKYILKQGSLTDTQKNNADVNSDGKISSADYIMIKKIIMGGGSTPNPTSKVTFNRSQYTMVEGKTEKIVATVSTGNAVTWTSSDSSVASVDSSGVVTAHKQGSVTIKATTSDGATKSANVKVYPSGLEVVDTYHDTRAYVVSNFNVLSYGADPYGEKDSTEAFKAALAAARDCIQGKGNCNGGGIVFVPKGKYIITDQLIVEQHVGLVGDLKEGTTDGTVLMIKYGANDTNYSHAAIRADCQAYVANIAFYYPDQKIDSNLNAVKYPPTILFGRSNEGIQIENINFVNSYIAMDFASSHVNISIQFIRDVYGTPLNIGMVNDTNLDTSKIDNVNFSPKYWLNSGFSNTPSESTLRKYLLSREATGFLIERVDWFFLANIDIDGYYYGIRLQESSNRVDSSKSGIPEGELYDARIINCHFPIYISKSKHFVITNATLSATDGGNSAGIYVSTASTGDISINSSNISSNGIAAINNLSPSAALSVTSTTVNGKINRGGVAMSLINTRLTNTGDFKNAGLEGVQPMVPGNYDKKVTTKPKSKKIITIKGANNSDITQELKNAISSLSSTGGIVYIPVGTFTVSNHIEVSPGIEIRGSTPYAHNNVYGMVTTINTSYKGDVLFTLNRGSGLNGLNINYPSQRSSLEFYPYTVRGNGDNVYVINVSMPSSTHGIDLFTHKCNNHYVEHLWGYFLGWGVKVGNYSSNGIIRESHFTVNVIRSDINSKIREQALNNQISFEIGPSANEVLFHNFVWGADKCYRFTNFSHDFTAVGNGCDRGRHGVNVSGEVNNGTFINSLLVNQNDPGNTYIKIEGNHSGKVSFYNTMMWGNDKDVSVNITGTGNTMLYGGIINHSGSPIINITSSNATIAGLIMNKTGGTKFQISNPNKKIHLYDNICFDGGKKCIEGVSGNNDINVVGIN